MHSQNEPRKRFFLNYFSDFFKIGGNGDLERLSLIVLLFKKQTNIKQQPKQETKSPTKNQLKSNPDELLHPKY